MKEISCPKCGSVFKVDEADYASIVHQVKNAEFRAEIDRRMAELNKQHQAEERANALQSEQTFREKLSVKELEIGKEYFSPRATLECGQTFRYERDEGGYFVCARFF